MLNQEHIDNLSTAIAELENTKLEINGVKQAIAPSPGFEWVAMFAKKFRQDGDRLELMCGRVPDSIRADVCKDLLERL